MKRSSPQSSGRRRAFGRGALSAALLLLAAARPAGAQASAATPSPDAPPAAGTSATPVPTRVAQAEALADQAYAAYQAGDALRAVELYLNAQKLAPSADILYNVAHIYDLKLGDRRLAMEFYRRSVAEPGASGERIVKANRRLLELKEADLAAAGLTALPAPTPARAAQPPAPADRGTSGREVAGWSLGALGLAGVGLGVGFGIAAKNTADRVHRNCDGDLCRSGEDVEAVDDARRQAFVATVGFVSGGVLLATGATLLLLGRGQEQRSAGARSPALRWGAVATGSELSLQVAGTW